MGRAEGSKQVEPERLLEVKLKEPSLHRRIFLCIPGTAVFCVQESCLRNVHKVLSRCRWIDDFYLGAIL